MKYAAQSESRVANTVCMAEASRVLCLSQVAHQKSCIFHTE